MTALGLLDHPRHTDHLRLRDGRSVIVRFIAPDDADMLQNYFRNLSGPSRYNRFLGAVSELPPSQLDGFTHAGEDDRFSVMATVMMGAREIIVGEARYGFDAATAGFEFGISVDDNWQGRGIGSLLIGNLECRAAALGAAKMFGDTLRSNETMIALARKLGFSFIHQPDDWKLVRFEKSVGVEPEEIPCASWRLVAAQRALEAIV